MKKTITRPDGSTEVIEGTAEEIAQYENQLREEGSVDKKTIGKKRVLTDEVRRLDEQQRDFQKAVEEYFKRFEDERNKTFPYVPPSMPPWISPFRYQPIEQECAVEAFFKKHPDATTVGLVCFCPRCTVYCYASVDGNGTFTCGDIRFDRQSNSTTVLACQDVSPVGDKISIPTVFGVN